MSKPERLEVIRLVELVDGDACITVHGASSPTQDLVEAAEGAYMSVDTGQEGVAGAIAVVRELVAQAWEANQPEACAWLTGIHKDLEAEAIRAGLPLEGEKP